MPGWARALFTHAACGRRARALHDALFAGIDAAKTGKGNARSDWHFEKKPDADWSAGVRHLEISCGGIVASCA